MIPKHRADINKLNNLSPTSAEESMPLYTKLYTPHYSLKSVQSSGMANVL